MMHRMDFFIIGAQKASTTSLHRILQQHPDIFLPDKKELEYFSLDDQYQQGEEYLSLYYQNIAGERCVGLSDVQLVFLEQAPERLHAYNPQVKLIVTCRNPIDRAYSAYWYLRHNGREDADTFEAAIERELEVRQHGMRDRADQCYLEHGHYGEQINRFLRLFSRENMYVLLTDDMRTPEYLPDLVSWLGLDPGDIVSLARKRQNQASAPRFRWLQGLLRNPDSLSQRLYKRSVPHSVRRFVTQNIVNVVSRWNMRPFQYPEMLEGTRKQLQAYFAPHNRILEAILGKDLSHWK